MKMSKSDVAWLRDHYRNLTFDASSMTIVGALEFQACYDKADGDLIVDCDMSAGGDGNGSSRICIADVFDVEMRLLPQTPAPSFPDPFQIQWPPAADLNPFEYPEPESGNSPPWPSVREIGGRRAAIARKEGATLADLHFYEDETCCLSIRLALDPHLRIDRFIHDLVIPFFYRLSFVDAFGLQAARAELWGEYSHGRAGMREYVNEMRAMQRLKVRPREACPCESGRRFRDCCAADVRAVPPPPQRQGPARLCPVAVSEMINGVRRTRAGGAITTLML